MTKKLETVKLRTRKSYKNASNHVLVGQVESCNQIFVRVKCRSFHYKYVTLEKDQVIEGIVDSRIVPWTNIECMSVLPVDFPWETAELGKCNQGICLHEGEYDTLISRYRITH